MEKIILTGSLKERNENKARLVNVTDFDIKKAEQVLKDNGIEDDETACVLQAIGYALLGVELYPNELDSPYKREFKNNFTIQFNYKGVTHIFTLYLSEIDKDYENNSWSEFIHGSNIVFEVFGTLDDLGLIRTSGRCIAGGKETFPAFGINVAENGEVVDTIDDIDIIEAN